MTIRPAFPIGPAMLLTAALAGCGSVDDVRTAGDRTGAPYATGLTATFLREIGGGGAGPGEFDRPTGISVNALGQAFVVDAGNDRIQVFSPLGAYIGEVGGFGWSSRQFNEPLGIDAGGGLDVWVADTGNRRIAHLDGNLHWLGLLNDDLAGGFTNDLGFPTDVATAPDGWLWFTDRDTDRLRRISPYRELVDSPAGGFTVHDLNDPMGLAVGQDGSIIVADTGNDRIVFYDRFGSPLRNWGWGYLTKPHGVAVTAHGDIVVADTGNDRVVLLNRLGREIGTVGGPGSGPASFFAPYGVAVDARRGNLWVTDSGNNRVQVFSLVRTTE